MILYKEDLKLDKYTIAEEAYKKGYNQALIDRVGNGWDTEVLNPFIKCKNCNTIFEISNINKLENFRYCPFCGKAHI